MTENTTYIVSSKNLKEILERAAQLGNGVTISMPDCAVKKMCKQSLIHALEW